MNQLIDTIILNSLAIWIFVSLMFLIASLIKNNSIMDTAWGLNFILIAAVSLFWSNQKIYLILILVIIWGLRLSCHIFLRNFKKPEDYRYKGWRDEWLKKGRFYLYLRSYLQVFLLQGVLSLIISLPIQIALSTNNIILSKIDFFILGMGLLVWTLGFLFESIGDLQLSQFLKKKKQGKTQKKIITEGLWAYTRHPNYFGEVTLWWGFFLICFAYSHNVFTLISPIVISFLILKVSGIPMLEQKYQGNKEWEEYAKKTNAFWPKFTKK